MARFRKRSYGRRRSVSRSRGYGRKRVGGRKRAKKLYVNLSRGGIRL